MSLLETIRSIHMEPYDYPLEEDRIAKFPVEPRDSSNLLLYRSGSFAYLFFRVTRPAGTRQLAGIQQYQGYPRPPVLPKGDRSPH